MFFKYLILTAAIFGFFLQLQAQERRVIVCDKPSDENDYRRWLERDAFYLITKKEKEDFLKLQSNEERENFITNFWLRRDPTPDTEENEFRETYYERIAFTNENFSSGTPGWRTDRGMIYILYGKPDKIERSRAEFEGLRDVLFEKWFYKYLDEEGANVEFVFLDPTETDEFRLEKGKREKLLKNLESGLITCFTCHSLE